MTNAKFLQVILVICMVINGIMLAAYVLGINRWVEEQARNNWTLPGAEKRQATEAIELQRDSQEENTTTELAPGTATAVPQNATEPRGLGELPVSGLVFDLIFGAETGLNLGSDIMMQVALRSWKSPGTKQKLGLFLGWNCCTTGVCYITSLFLADFYSRVLPYDPNKVKDRDEASYRAGIKFGLIIRYTVVLVVKVVILGCIFMFYSNWENLAKEDDNNQQGYVLGGAAPFPGYYPGAPPAAYYPGAPPGAFPGPGGGAYPVQYYPGQYYQPPPQGAAIAPPGGEPPTKQD